MIKRETREAPTEPLPLEAAIDLYPLKVVPVMPLLEVIALMNQGDDRSFSSSQVSTSDSGQTGRNRSSYALVMIDEQLVGIFTERDVVRLTSQGINLADRAIGDVMTQSLVTLQASDLQDPSAVLHRFRKHRIRHLPVLNGQQQVVGVATQRSIRQTLQSADLLRLRRVTEVMSTQVISAPPEATVLELASTMATHRVSCVVITQSTEPITGSKVLPIGIVTERDIVQFQALGLDLCIQAQAVMSAPLRCLQPEDDLWAAHQTMEQLHVRRLVVADSHGTLAGILTQTSILAALDPLEMQHTIAFLKEQVDRLQDERLQWLQAHASQLENQVQATEQRYSNLSETAPVGIFRADILGNCTYVNSLWCQIVGILPAEAIGIGWFQNIHPEDQYSVGIAWRCATETQQPFRLEYRFQTPSGQVTWVFGQAVAEIGSDGEISGYIGTITDITERKLAETALQASEARLKEAQQIAQIGNWELDLKTNTLIWSDEMYRIFEIENPQEFEATYETFFRAVHPEDRDLANQAYENSIKKRRPHDITYRLLMADGRIKYVHKRCQTVYDSAGYPLRSMGTLQDITGRRQIQDALQYQLTQAQVVAQISTRFSNLASADLDVGIRQTLREIATFTQMDICSMVQFSPVDETLTIIQERTTADLAPDCSQPQTLLASSLPWITTKIQQGEIICVANLTDLPIEAVMDRAHWQTLGMHALVAVPIRYRNDVMGWIGCGCAYTSWTVHPESESIPRQETDCFFQAVELLKLVGEIFAHALQRRNTEAELYQYQHRLEELVASRTAELQESEARFRTMADTAPVLIWMSGVNQLCTYCNQGWLKFTGRTMKQELGRGWTEGIHPDDFEPCLDTYMTALETRQSFQIEYRLRRFDGEYRWMLNAASPRFLRSGEFAGFIGSCVDITDHKHMAQELFREKERAQVTLHSIGDAVITTNAQGQVEYFNPVAEQLTGWDAAIAKGRPLAEVFNIVHEVTREPAENPVERVLREGRVVGLANHTVLISRQGKEYCIEDSAAPMRDRIGRMIGVVMVFHDVTHSRKLARRLSWQASHDALTGLANRQQFEQSLMESLQSVQQGDQVHVLCYLDLDQFKVVNDTCGHVAGDELLRQISRLLKVNIRATDILARLGGDEFGILLKQCPLPRAELIAEKLRATVQNFRFLWKDKVFSVGVSIGLVLLDTDSHTLTEVLSAADAACYAAKGRGRNRVHIYQANDSELAKQRGERQWSLRIRQALAENRFCLYSQTIASTVKFDAVQQVHCEILLRMIDEEGDLILPGAFIPAAERYGLMSDIDRWVVKTFFAYLEHSQQPQIPMPENDPDVLYLINLSGASVGDVQFLDFLKEQFSGHMIAPQTVGFEITETAAISNLEQATHFIRELKQLGCHFALDDFGSGMSSFGYLKTLPVDHLKIDGKFIEDMNDDPAAYAMVEAINHVGHVMGLKTIAESVESSALREKLAQIGVDYVQGYGIERPQPIS